MMTTLDILKGLGLSAINAGGSTGAHWWASGETTSQLASVNPATGETMQIAASKKVAFRPAKELKEAV